MKHLLIVFSFLFINGLVYSQDFTIRGFLSDKKNGEPVAYEKVRLLRSADSSTVTGAVTDISGIFSIPKIEKGSYILKIDNFNYGVVTRNIEVTAAKGFLDVKIELEKLENVKEYDEVNASADGKRKKNEVQISKLQFDTKGLERVPSYGAENDVVGAFSVTPGVVTTGDQGGQLYVRGGTPIQNKVLLDGMTIYNPFHSIGFFSIFFPFALAVPLALALALAGTHPCGPCQPVHLPAACGLQRRLLWRPPAADVVQPQAPGGSGHTMH